MVNLPLLTQVGASTPKNHLIIFEKKKNNQNDAIAKVKNNNKDQNTYIHRKEIVFFRNSLSLIPSKH